MTRYLLIFIFFFFLHFVNEIQAQNYVKAVRTTEPPVIDGNLEKIWEQAEIIDDFYQREPVEGEKISERTECLDRPAGR